MYNLTELNQIKDTIQSALTVDAVNLIGVHKLVDFNLLDQHFKDLWYCFFTKYTPSRLATKKIQCSERLKQSQQDNLMELIDNVHLKLIVDYTLFRLKHLKIINEVIQNYNNDSLKKLFVFELNNPYDQENKYPYLNYEGEACYATI